MRNKEAGACNVLRVVPLSHLQWFPLGPPGHLVETDQHGGAGDDADIGVTQAGLCERVDPIRALAEQTQLVAAFV